MIWNNGQSCGHAAHVCGYSSSCVRADSSHNQAFVPPLVYCKLISRSVGTVLRHFLQREGEAADVFDRTRDGAASYICSGTSAPGCTAGQS